MAYLNDTIIAGDLKVLNGVKVSNSITLGNNVWNLVGDDVKIGDFNKAGLLGVMGANGTTGIALCKKDTPGTYNTITYDGTTLTVADGNAKINFTTSATAPNTTNVLTLGASGKVWKQLFAATTTISTSDERQKQQIEDIPDEVLDAWGEVEFKQFKFNSAVEEKGENARIHMGLIAQRIKEVFEKHNLDPFKYGFFCYDEWDVHENPKDENSPVIRRENGYALRYEEALIIEAAYQRRRLDRLEAIIKNLQA